jgi:hypothetical protein
MFPFPPLPSSKEDPAGYRGGLPHSDIDGSLGARPLPIASRSRATSFVGSTTPGHPPSAVLRFRAPARPRSCDFSYACYSLCTW